MKPSDLFVGVIDFFSALVPGAIATFLLVFRYREALNRWPFLTWESSAGWAVFLVAAYVMGQLISAIGSVLLDPIYDRLYARWQRSAFLHQKPEGEMPWLNRLDRVLEPDDPKNPLPDDPLLAISKLLKKDQLKEWAQKAKVKESEISNTFWWAATVVRMRTLDGAAEIDLLSAQSKLFRGLSLLVPLALWVENLQCVRIPAWLILLIFPLSLWRFMKLRWDATERTYEYFIAATVLPPAGGAASPTASAGDSGAQNRGRTGSNVQPSLL